MFGGREPRPPLSKADGRAVLDVRGWVGLNSGLKLRVWWNQTPPHPHPPHPPSCALTLAASCWVIFVASRNRPPLSSPSPARPLVVSYQTDGFFHMANLPSSSSSSAAPRAPSLPSSRSIALMLCGSVGLQRFLPKRSCEKPSFSSALPLFLPHHPFIFFLPHSARPLNYY